jgi:outer membrane protein OmpA-like peptidoglycan-associated protein/tetratricopeptide (TPR) repeat protein
VKKNDVMRYYHYSLVIILLMYSSVLDAQTDVSIRRKDFKVAKEGFKEAWKHVGDGDSYYSKKGIWYGSAFDEYLKAIVYNNSNPELNYKTGVSALYSDKKEEAAGFLLKAFEFKNDMTKDILLLTGRALHYAGRYSEAIEKFNAFLTSPGKKSKATIILVKKSIEECSSALIVTKDTLRIAINNIGSNINSGSDDYSEVLSTDGKIMFFASRREISKSSDYYPDMKYDENIFISRQINDSWELSATVGKNLTTKYCETPLYINSTNDRLYIYAGYENGGDIKMSVSKKGKWRSPVTIPYRINTGGSETSFTFSPSGNEIYFVTDKGKKSIGGKDIYFIKKLSERKWSKPQNAGPAVNTVYDEESVRFSKRGDTLWFSSKGHNTIGGFDIFYSVKNRAGEWDSVKNYGYPVNTPWDELFYHPSPQDDSAFYFVSNRSGGLGGLDIYHGRILPPEPVVVIVPPAPPKPDTVIIRDTIVIVKEVVPVEPPPVAPVVLPEPVPEMLLFLVGKVLDSETGAPVIAKIDVIDPSTTLVVSTSVSSDADGSYRVRLPEKKTYMIDLRATGFLSEMKRIDVPDNWPRDVYNFNVELIKVKVGKKVVLNNILFETGKSILTSGSSAEIDRLYNILIDNPLMKIEISGHTDKTGSEPINFKLSENRAKAVVEYLVQKGIDRSRMEFKGFGSLQPIADNATSQGRAKNRRVEFKILEF